MPQPLNIAIVGGGPAGLGAAIAFLKLDNVTVKVFEQASELKEVGAGISINDNTWRILNEFGAAEHLREAFARETGGSVGPGEHRNGRTGALLASGSKKENPNFPLRSRVERYKLQQALLSQVPAGVIQLKKRLSKIVEGHDGRLDIEFEDGARDAGVDLLIGADGLRSPTRSHFFPKHKISYTGKIAYRVIIPQESVAHIPNIPNASVFWHTPSTHVFTTPLGDGRFEIATRAIEDEEYGKKVSWGRQVEKERVVKHYEGYCETIKQIISVPDNWLEFAMFGGPRLESVVHGGNVALIGDASHPLSGAFGSGAAFALEDAYVLAGAVDFARSTARHSDESNLAYALRLFDEVRGEHYEKLFDVLDSYAATGREISLSQVPLSDDEKVGLAVEKNWTKGGTGWIYEYNVTQVWADRVALERRSNDQHAEANTGLSSHTRLGTIEASLSSISVSA